MQSTQIFCAEQVQEHRLSGSIENFFKEYHVGTLLHRCGIRKCRGISPMIVLHCLFGLSFGICQWKWDTFFHKLESNSLGLFKSVVHDRTLVKSGRPWPDPVGGICDAVSPILIPNISCGRFIHAASGTASGRGIVPLKRIGFFSKADLSTFARWAITLSDKP